MLASRDRVGNRSDAPFRCSSTGDSLVMTTLEKGSKGV
jgi:hypothetical protein